MNTTFIITGGAGRVITAIPALEKFYRLNPNDDFKVIVHGWDSLYWSHPILQKRTFEISQKGLFELIVKNSKLKTPEPYHNYRFYNQKISLIEAFDEEINNTINHKDLTLPSLYLTQGEEIWIQNFIYEQKQKYEKNKIVVFQPYGSGIQVIGNQVIDPTNRSLTVDAYYNIVKEISKEAIVFYASQSQFRPNEDQYSITFDDMNPYLRAMIGLIKYCDYFVGIDSVGQHMARVYNKPGFVMMGGTNEINFSYPNHFTIFRNKNIKPSYSPWRILDTDVNFANRENDGIMNFTKEDYNTIITTILTNLRNKS